MLSELAFVPLRPSKNCGMALELPFIPIGPNPNGPATGRGGIPSSAKLGRLAKGPFGALACLRGDD